MFFPTVSIPGEGSTFAKTFTTISESFYPITSIMVGKKNYLQIILTPSSSIKLQNVRLKSLASFKSPMWLAGLGFFLPKCIMLSSY